MKRVRFVTVGCKLNQFETELMREAAVGAGYQATGDDSAADVYVVNTCTVTAKSDYRSRQALRRAIRANPGALIVATGCYAQRSPGDLAAIGGVDVIVGNAEKERIEGFLAMTKPARPLVSVACVESVGTIQCPRRLHGFGRYTRAFVKIQDGCDNHCTYCAVPLARGRSRSKHPHDVKREVETLTGAGYREIVLTGVHLGSYGKDLELPTSLVDLIGRLAEVQGLARLRLSSIEPTDFTDDLIAIMGDPAAKVCPHVHVPLQSGDDRILALMGRPYERAFYSDLILKIAGAVPGCGVGADVIVGFPSEDRAAFESTCRLIEALPITYLHAFAFSPRENTPAVGLGPQVDPAAKKERSSVIRALGKAKSEAFRASLVGKDMDVLVLGTRSGGRPVGLSGNYVKVSLDGDAAPNTLVSARILQVVEGGLLARPSKPDRSA